MTIGPKHSQEDVERIARLGLEEYKRALAAGDSKVAARRSAYRRIERESFDHFFIDRGRRRFRQLQKEQGI